MAEDNRSAKARIDGEAERRRAWLALTHFQRLRWLEDAKRFCAIALGAARKRPSRGTGAKGREEG